MKFTLKIVFLVTAVIACSLSPARSQNDLDSLNALLKNARDTARVELLNEIIFHQNLSDPEAAEKTIEQMQQLSREINYSRGEALALNNLATLRRYQGLYDEAIALSDSVLEISEPAWKSLLASTHVNLGVSHRYKGESELALDNYLQAIEIYKEIGDREQMATVYNNIGVMFMYRDDYADAMRYYGKALEIQEELENLKGMAEVYNNMAIIQAYQEQYDSSLFYFNRSLDLETQRGSKKGMSECINNIGSVYYYMGDYDRAIEETKRSMQLDAEMDNVQGQIASMNNIAEIHIEAGEPEKAIPFLEKSEKLSREIDSKYDRETAYLNFTHAYEKMDDHEKALEYHYKYAALSDSLLDEREADKIAELEVQFKTKEAEQDLALKELQVQEQQASLAARRNMIIALAIGIALILVFSLAFYQRYRAKKNQELQSAIIQEQKKGLEAVIQATEVERKRIAKDLHDGIGQQLSGLKLSMSQLNDNLQHIEENDRHRLAAIAEGLDLAASEVRSISHQMMPRALEELGLVAALDDMLHKSLGITDIEYRFEHFQVEGKRFAENVEIGLYRICQELVNNIIKHSSAKFVSVQLLLNRKKLILIVEDNGKGFNPSQKKDGMGLMNINSRVQTVNGEVNYNPSPESGTVATIRIPIED